MTDEERAAEYASHVSTAGRVLVDLYIGDREFTRVTDIVHAAFLDGLRASRHVEDGPEEWTRQRIEAELKSDIPNITIEDGLWLLERCRPLHESEDELRDAILAYHRETERLKAIGLNQYGETRHTKRPVNTQKQLCYASSQHASEHERIAGVLREYGDSHTLIMNKLTVGDVKGLLLALSLGTTCVKCGRYPATICQGNYDIMEEAWVTAQKELDRLRAANPARVKQVKELISQCASELALCDPTIEEDLPCPTCEALFQKFYALVENR